MEKTKPVRLESCFFYKAGKWELYVFFSARGTKSEGAFGMLVEDGSLILGRSVGEEMETDLGKMKYYGPDAEVLWAPRGWLFEDKSLIPNSGSL